MILNIVINASPSMKKNVELTIRTFNKKINSLNFTPKNIFSTDKESIEHRNYVVIEVIDKEYEMTYNTI
ncbi:MAG: hypothetical protein ACR5KW_02820 [Wolbachia sp.]